MEKIPLAIVGCGVMGTRHLAGFVELTKSGFNKFELAATCDPVSENAQKLAKIAQDQLGQKIAVVEKLEELAPLGVLAIDVTTPPWSHHTICLEALSQGLNVMMEKPMGVTMRACRLMLEAVEKSKSVLMVAENFHYDPMNLLGRELIRSGAIGDLRCFVNSGIGGGNRVIVTPWRHYKRSGGPILDVGVHNFYVTEYLVGKVDSVYAHARLYEKIRINNPGSSPAEVKADAEDAVYAALLFENGVIGQYIEDHAAHGQGMRNRMVYGSKGSLNSPPDRSGQPNVLTLDGVGTVNNERILEYVPEFRLDKVTAALFGDERLWRYELPFPEIDRKLLAVEYADFGEAIATGKKPEVSLINATRAVAIPYAMLESSNLGIPVKIDDVMNGTISAYQDEIDKDIGLI